MRTQKLPLYVFTVIFGLAGLSEIAAAQTYSVSDDSEMTIYGSANVTDWESEVKTIHGEITIRNLDQSDWSEAQVSWFERVEVSIPVEDIDSDSRRMNNNMHGYLKKSEYPNITYSLIEVQELVLLDNPGVVLTVRGVISAAGVSKEIVHDVTITESESGGFVVSGSQDLKMTDFGIDPPTAVLGSIRSRDEMTITFRLYLE